MHWPSYCSNNKYNSNSNSNNPNNKLIILLLLLLGITIVIIYIVYYKGNAITELNVVEIVHTFNSCY